MSTANRRGFLKIAGAGAAAVGATSLVGAAAGTDVAGAAAVAAVPASASESLPAGASGSMVAYVKDVSTGEVSLMVEGHEVTVTDHQLVAKLAKAMRSSSKV